MEDGLLFSAGSKQIFPNFLVCFCLDVPDSYSVTGVHLKLVSPNFLAIFQNQRRHYCVNNETALINIEIARKLKIIFRHSGWRGSL